MEQKLYEAAMEGSVPSLREILAEDSLILDRLVLCSFNMAGSPLHAAVSRGHAEFVRELLDLNPDLAEVTDSLRRSPLHLAAAKGHLQIVRELASASPELCAARDSEGRNPIHVAAIKGKVEVLKELVLKNPHAARAKVEASETIFHLCIKYGQWKSLEMVLDMIRSPEIVEAKDGDGNTVLHLAVADEQVEIVKYLLETLRADVNPTNAYGDTPLDTLLESETESEEIEDFLIEFGAKRSKDLVKGQWLTKKRDALMVAASLIATMAFQAGVSPAGGVWQNDSNGHRAGETVMAYNYPDSFHYFIRANTTGLVASLSIILLLTSGLPFRKRAFMWVLEVIMWLTITAMAFTYAFSIVVVTPKKDREPLSSTIMVAVIVWCSLMAVLLLVRTVRLGTAMVQEQRIMYMATHKIFGCGSSRWRLKLRRMLSNVGKV